MNELTALRELRADAPLPDSDRLAPARVRLTEVFREETPGGVWQALPRRRIVLVGVAATAALSVTGGIVATLPGDAPAGRRLLSARASAAALELAAATVEKTPVVEPGPKQWVYVKTTVFFEGEPQNSESWTRWDGTGHARLPGIPPSGPVSDFDPNELQVWYGPNQEEKWKKEGYDDRSQRQFWRFLVTLPGDDPDRMMRRIREEHAIGDIEGETPAERDWREIHVLYRSVLIPSNVQAGLFRALAKIPDARVTKGVKDSLGRAAISVSVHYAERTASGAQGTQEILFDPKTYAYLGEAEHVAPIEPPKGQTLPSPSGRGSDTMVIARAAWGVVNKPGARP
ncbi:CU044_5270 family protein [Streptomyces sp. NPDC057099]|uniref:CU044_5270 family protein n=1 Tax=Streptomyces sp. NPDC057099 TaxID=3346019 RepID=UPI00363586F9